MNPFKTFLKWCGVCGAGGAALSAGIGFIPGVIAIGTFTFIFTLDPGVFLFGGGLGAALTAIPGAIVGGLVGVLSSPLLLFKKVRDFSDKMWVKITENKEEKEPLLAASPDTAETPLPSSTIGTASVAEETYTTTPPPSTSLLQPSFS